MGLNRERWDGHAFGVGVGSVSLLGQVSGFRNVREALAPAQVRFGNRLSGLFTVHPGIDIYTRQYETTE